MLRPLGLRESVVNAFPLPSCLLVLSAPPANKTAVMQPHSVNVMCCDGLRNVSACSTDNIPNIGDEYVTADKSR